MTITGSHWTRSCVTTSATALFAVAGSVTAFAAHTHTIRRGETLASVANEFHISVRALANANDLDPTDHVRRGRRLVIPERAKRLIVEPTMHHDTQIKGDRVSLRRGPGESYGRVVFVDDATPLTVTAHRHGWFQVELDSGRTGWVSEDYVAHAARLAQRHETSDVVHNRLRHSRPAESRIAAARHTMAGHTAAVKASRGAEAARHHSATDAPARETAERGDGRHRSSHSIDRALAAHIAGAATRAAAAAADLRRAEAVAVHGGKSRPQQPQRQDHVAKRTRHHHGELALDVSSRARDIVRTAYAYRGTPYVYGGASRGGFDCSGFTSYLYGRQGISLPHSAREQFRMGRHVNRADLKPGDLVFFHTVTPGISHVGMYVGNGRFVHASSRRSGGVRVDNLDSGYYSSAYRGATRLR